MDRGDDSGLVPTPAADDGAVHDDGTQHAAAAAPDVDISIDPTAALLTDLVLFPAGWSADDSKDNTVSDGAATADGGDLTQFLANLPEPAAGGAILIPASIAIGHDAAREISGNAADLQNSSVFDGTQLSVLGASGHDDSGDTAGGLAASLPVLAFAASESPNAPGQGADQSAIGGPLPELVPSDPMFGQQWHLLAINVESVWNDYTGKGVTIGLIDDGVEYTHPDLAANYNTAIDYDARNKDNDAFSSSTTDQHGTSVAGVMAAVEGNGIGVVGVAYGATITGFRMGFGSAGSVSQITDNFQHAIVVDVVNNSWGFGGFFTDNFATSTFAAAGAAVQNDAANGRGGLGTVIVFAAGNARTSGDSVDYHGFQDSQFVISVAATDSTNHVTYFSEPGAGVLLAAPGLNITTTDRVGSLGFSSGDYTTVSGTSFSSPIVSGVVALMLEANPHLGYRDVQEILAYSSDKVDTTSSRWMTNGAGNWNGGGLHFSPDYGFGLVDAHAAVRLAETWTDQSTFANMVTVSNGSSASQAIPDNTPSGISQSVLIGSNVDIDHVTVDLNVTHTWIGDLRVILISPDGTQSVLVDRPGINPDAPAGTGSSQQNINFTIDSNQFWGEHSAGTWTLVVSDNNPGQTGALNSWTLHVYGDPVTSNEIYIYTDEYAGFTGAANASHRVLTDSDGGNDTINASAVTSSTFLDLTPGHNSTIAGNTLTISAGSVIENAYTGDGNDTVLANSVGDFIDGGRGADSLIGGAGNDTLEGGAGNDTLDGGAGIDTALFTGAFSDYNIVIVDSTHVTVTDTLPGGTDGTDSLANFEFLQFSDFLDALNAPPPNTPPTANNDTATTAEDTTVTVSVLANDTDSDGDTLSVTGVTAPGHGAASINPNGTITYTPGANYNGADSFNYTISDGHGNTSQATVNVTVTPVNDPPVANPDSATTTQNVAVNVNVLANDTDVDGDILSVTGVTNGAHGTVAINPDNTVTYTPANNYTGGDSFNYTVSDGHGGTAQGTVSITVNSAPNQPPVAVNDAATTAEDTAVTVTVLANDSDPNGDTLSVTGATNPAHGTAVVNANGTITYTPSANYNGADSFNYTISDGHGGTAQATVNVTVTPVNDPPVANPDSAATTQNVAVNVNVLANDTDVDGDTLSVTGVTNGAHGTVTINPNNTVTYTPASNYTGGDSFNYTVSDGHGGTAQGTVSITVNSAPNQPPVAVNDAATTAEDTAVVISVLANDSDPNGDTLSVTGATNPAHGTAVVNANGTITYTPAANYNGADSFNYTISDGHGGTAQATVNVNVTPVNDPPVANPDSAVTTQNTPVSVNVLANDTDVDGDTLSVAGTTNPAHGTVVVNANGSITYTPTSNYTGADSFTYTVSDGHGGTAIGNVSLTVNSANPPPPPVTLISADFASSAGGFTYIDDAFRGTNHPSFESGAWSSTGGFSNGALNVTLGGINSVTIQGMSGGWQQSFSLSAPTDVTLSLHYDMTQSPNYSSGEFSQFLVRIDGTLYGANGHDYVAQIAGDGAGGPSITTGWQTFSVDLGVLSAGSHTIVIGGYNNQKDAANQTTTISIDDVNLVAHPAAPASVSSLSADAAGTAPQSSGQNTETQNTGTMPLASPLDSDGPGIGGHHGATSALGTVGALGTLGSSAEPGSNEHCGPCLHPSELFDFSDHDDAHDAAGPNAAATDKGGETHFAAPTNDILGMIFDQAAAHAAAHAAAAG